MSMLKQCVKMGLLVISLSFGSHLQAGNADDMKTALADARTHLLSMLDTTDKATQDSLREKITAATALVDKALAAAEADTSLAAPKVSEFKAIWEAFKNTRETEIIPAVYAGKNDEAKAISKNVQAERVKQMNAILTELGAK